MRSEGSRRSISAMNTNPTFVVETEGLTKRFGARVAVNGVDLRIPAGSAFGYLGPNGAGKTTERSLNAPCRVLTSAARSACGRTRARRR
jgi:ABC-2 type transport system ATP-binding protein